MLQLTKESLMINFHELLPSPEELSDKELSSIASFLMELACAFESEYSEHLKRHYKKQADEAQALYDFMASTNKNNDDPDNNNF